MKNCIILGSARSGTSMVAGVLSKSNYFMGKNLIGPNRFNPKGNLESIDINELNNSIIHVSLTESRIPKDLPRYAAWLYELPLEMRITSPTPFDDQIASLTKQEPYCFKDPRFSYALPAWQPYVNDAIYICVFREPDKTIDSIVKAAKYYHDVEFSEERASNVWIQMYNHILESHKDTEELLFLHFNQVIAGDGIEKLREMTGADVDKSFPDAMLSKSASMENVPEQCTNIYKKLCELAGYESKLK